MKLVTLKVTFSLLLLKIWPLTAANAVKSKFFSLKFSNYNVDFNITNSRSIVIVFDTGWSARQGGMSRDVWSGSYFKSTSQSYIGIKPRNDNWFIDGDLRRLKAVVRFVGMFYDRVVSYGSSMGGFGALTYADLFNVDYVLAYSPQSSRDPMICSWEDPIDPFYQSKDMNFKSHYADASNKYLRCKKVYIIYDPYVIRDKRHAERLVAGNVKMVKAPFSGHPPVLMMASIGLLKYPIEAVISEKFSEDAFYNNYRARRYSDVYWKNITMRAKGRARMLEIIARNKIEYLPKL